MLVLKLCMPVHRGVCEFEQTTKSLLWSNVTVGLAAMPYIYQEMQDTDMLQTHDYQKAEELEVQLESGAHILLMHF